MKFKFIESSGATRFDGVYIKIRKGTVIHQVKPHDAWKNSRGKFTGCGITNLLEDKVVIPMDNEARELRRKYNQWKKFVKEHPRTRNDYTMYGGFGYTLLGDL